MSRKNPVKCICPICGKEYLTYRPHNPPRTCSKECAYEKRRRNYMEKYGKPSHNTGNNREKAKQTCLEKYGVENPSQIENIKEKKKQEIKPKLTKEEFIKQAKILYGNKYDYSKINYIDQDTCINIKCNECCSVFEHTPKYHLKGYGCSNCKSLKPFDEFVKEARKIHGNKYEYNKKDYYSRQYDVKRSYGTTRKIKIYCNQCKQYFIQDIQNHLLGKGCVNCSKSRHLSKEEFFNKIKSIFGDIYDYSKAIYIDSKHKMKLYCKKCDIWFEKDTHGLLQGKGCPYCSSGTPDSYKIFVEKARKVHGNKYEYDEESFKLNNHKVKIYCKHCKKWFYQLKSGHLTGKGCLTCSGKERKTTQKFIEEAKAIHGDKYDYSKTNYIRAWDKITITCNKCHNDFKIRARLHLDGQGCPNCAPLSKGEEKLKKLLTDKKIDFEQQKVFENCKYKKHLRFDFYLPKYNCCIEYQGEQHFNDNFFKRWKKGTIEFKEVLIRDNIKKEYCKNNNIRLYEIRYDENIEVKLNEILSLLEK